MIFSLAGDVKYYETEKSVEKIVQEINNNADKIIELNLRDNVFVSPALPLLFKAVKNIKNLRKLILSRVFSALPRDQMMKNFEIMLTNVNPETLFYLDLSENALSCDFPDFFVSFISKLKNLKVLKINNCGLGATGGENLANALDKIVNKENLLSIDISTNKLTSGATRLGEVLNKFYNLEELYIQYNNVDRKSMFNLLSSFNEHSLSILDLRDNFIDEEGCKLLGEYFVTWDVSLLRMSDCLIGDEGLKQFIEQANEKRNYIFCQGAFCNMEGISLDFGFNKITDEGLELLEDFLQDKKINQLWIEGNDFTECNNLINLIKNKGGEIFYKDEESDYGEVDDLEKRFVML